MEFKAPKSRVYIRTDDHVRITRCEGEYTLPSDLDGWILIEEGQPCDRLNLAQSHYFDGGTEEELEADRLPVITAQARAQRDKLLADCDWTQVLDAPIDSATREAYRAYRQALRDIPDQEGFPDTITWPELPATTKAAPDPVDTAADTLLGGETA